MSLIRIFSFIAIAILITGNVWAGANPKPPQVLMPAMGNTHTVAPDGSIEHYFMRGDYGKQTLMLIRSRDNGLTWTEPEIVMPLPPEGKWHKPFPLYDKKGQLHLFPLDLRTTEMGFWHIKFPVLPEKKWSEWQYIGTSGPQNAPIQLRNGRIIVPIGYMIPQKEWDSQRGRWECTTYYSDDDGNSWQKSPARLTVPCLIDYAGYHSGGYEPVIIELKDGRIWMLIRTQTGYLYESFSQDGVNWSEPQSTQFISSDAPGSFARLANGDIVLFWNNCQDPAPVDGVWMYTGRDALHAAISKDEGKTWPGYREVYLDPNRNELPPGSDRGTAYPAAAVTHDNQIILIAGQGKNRRRFILVDPNWLYETHQEDNFAEGLKYWSVFKNFGQIVSFSRPRTAGAHCIPHPNEPGKMVLHVRRPDANAPDGAAWNFPAGHVGKVSIRILLRDGFQGALVCLTDRFFYPDTIDMKHTTFALSIDKDGRLGKDFILEKDRWYNIDLAWEVEQKYIGNRWPGTCKVLVDGREVLTLPQLNRAWAGLSYLRLYSTADKIDPAGFLIQRVSADIERKEISSSGKDK